MENTTVQPQQVTPVLPQTDLISKVTQFKTPPPIVEVQGPDIGFDYKEIEAIRDPQAKEQAIKAYKSMQSGYTKKTQELSQRQKDLEAKLSEQSNWTPDRVKELLNNPNFVESAKVAAQHQNPQNSGLTDEEYSALSDREKGELLALRSKVEQLEQVNFHSLISNHDSTLRAKYQDYNPEMVNEGLGRLARLQPHEIREHIYKALLHDEHVKNAYEMGRQEKDQRVQEKINSFSPNNFQANTGDELPTREKNDSDQSWFLKLAMNRARQIKK